MKTDGFVSRLVRARLPTETGDFFTAIYDGHDDKEHVVLTMGELERGGPVLVRIHSECFTGDVLGSHRCDCGEQLSESLRRIAAEGRGVVVYLRQEGRGIGLADKLRAYNLQDLGYDTVDANAELGHAPDLRDYGVAARILGDLGIGTVRLLTNNPAKIASLRDHGIEVSERVPLVMPAKAENRRYLLAKVERMGHLLEPRAEPDAALRPPAVHEASRPHQADELFDLLARAEAPARPQVTLSYAQSLDGSSAALGDRPLAISGAESLRFTHRLRAAHDAILVGIGTVLSDDPRLTVRGWPGTDPQPVVLDSRLRFPLDARLLEHPSRQVFIATTALANPARIARIESLGARVLVLPADAMGRVDLPALLEALHELGVRRLMVEGGGRVISQFLAQRLPDLLVLTIAPMIVRGIRAVDPLAPEAGRALARLEAPRYLEIGGDMVVWGKPCWTHEVAPPRGVEGPV